MSCTRALRGLWPSSTWAMLLAVSLAAAPARAEDAAVDSAWTIAKGRSYHTAIKISDAARMWENFDETMRAGFGTAVEFETVLKQITGQVGRLETCLREVASLEGKYWVYRGDCRFSKSPVPLTLVLAFDNGGKISGLWIKPEAKPHATEHLDYQTKAELRLPFHDEWKTVWGGRTLEHNYHAVSNDQRFAYDFVIVKDGKTHTGSGLLNTDYHCFGVPIVAPAAGRVVLVYDGVRDNRPGRMNPKQPLGNAVILNHGKGEYSVFAHFRRSSVRVKLDQQVAAGDTLGLCGNSGNSSEPHLHFHLQDGPDPLAGAGLPAFFNAYKADAKSVERGEPTRGQIISRD